MVFRPTFDTLLAYVSRDDYLKIHAYCQNYDIERGNTDDYIYDAANGGGINVWNRATFFAPKPRREEAAKAAREALGTFDKKVPRASCCCTYRWERTDGKSPGELIESASTVQMHDEADQVEKVGSVMQFGLSTSLLGMLTRGCDVLAISAEPGFHLNIACDWSPEKDWPASLAQGHFLELHRRVLGKAVTDDWINRFV